MHNTASFDYSGARVLVTGGSGLLGRFVVAQPDGADETSTT